MQAKITIALADSDYLIRLGLRHLLDSIQDFEVIGESQNEADLLALLVQQPPQVIILDYNQPAHFSAATITKIRQQSPLSNVLIISSDQVKDTIYGVLEQGVNSFLTKRCDRSEIIDAVRATAKNEKFFCSTVLEYLLEKSFQPELNCTPTPLSPRELEIVQLVAKGMTAKEIANDLYLSPHTIYTHRKNIMKKLQLNNASELVRYAIDKGLLN